MVVLLLWIECVACLTYVALTFVSHKKHGVMHFFKCGRYNVSFCKSKKK